MAQSLSFSELCLALDPTFATNAAETKPLCENIFDVPRSELFESYNRLREAFWTTVPIATPPVQQNVVEAPLVKRHSTEPEQAQPQRQAKRRRTEVASISEAPNHKELVASSLSPSLLTLWGIKRILIQQIRCSLPSYNEAKVTALIKECDLMCSTAQKQHLAQYMKPVMDAMRRAQRYAVIEEALERWQEQ